ncbi:phosphatase PAP2 family protein [Bacillus sp. FJAT-47783]|uniref:phosphatase PAP2 family protein n=1 Tax=Bacillus sp. FJAT-47783 TaxID=2922712 RepID=UPI001FAD0CD0|nr:phosphatase PAP2 family protein [Bacillus sp. FJAT-47783]
MSKFIATMYDVECKLFKYVNQYFEKKCLNFYFRNITHIGGATFTILLSLLFIVFAEHPLKSVALASGAALLFSHIPVAIIKKLYPRKRPYIALQDAKILKNPLQDHSFPSGHTTAIFSLVTPYILFMPELFIIILPIAFSVALSRIYLGLHYPSDVLVGMFLGSCTGVICYTTITQLIT